MNKKITMYLNLKNSYVKETLEKFIVELGLDKDLEFWRKVENIERDVKFFEEFITRVGSTSMFEYEVVICKKGLIFDGFLNKINAYFNYYDFEYLKPYIYMYEVLVRLFNNHWIDGQGVNMGIVAKLKEFHSVVQYYLPDIKNISDYTHHFIGSSYGINLFNEALLTNEKEVEVSDPTKPLS
jgi:hypothetical protein